MDDSNFVRFRDDGGQFPPAATNAAIDRMSGAGIAALVDDTASDAQRLHDRAIVADLATLSIVPPPLFADRPEGEVAGHGT